MSDKSADSNRRNILTASLAFAGGIGIGATAIPFVRSMSPSASAAAAGADVEVDVSSMQPGELKVVEWRRMPVLILRRTSQMLEHLATLDDRLRDPKSERKSQQPDAAQNQHRSLKPEYLVLLGVCTHLGCLPNYVPQGGSELIANENKGGFLCPCHQSEYDFAGRVFKGTSPAPMNLPVPPHRFLTDTRIIIGEQTKPT